MADSNVGINIDVTSNTSGAKSGLSGLVGMLNQVGSAINRTAQQFQKLSGASQIKATVPAPAPNSAPPAGSAPVAQIAPAIPLGPVTGDQLAQASTSGVIQAQKILEAFQQIDQGAIEVSSKIKQYLPQGLSEALNQMISDSQKANQRMLADAIENAEAKKQAYLKAQREQLAAQDDMAVAQATKDAAPRGTKTAYNEIIKETKAELKVKTTAANDAYEAFQKADQKAATSAEQASKSIAKAYTTAGKEQEKAAKEAEKVVADAQKAQADAAKASEKSQVDAAKASQKAVEDAAKKEQKAQVDAAKASQKAFADVTRSITQGFNLVKRAGADAINNFNRMANGIRQAAQGLQELTQLMALTIAAPMGLFLRSATADAMSFEQEMAKVKKAVNIGDSAQFDVLTKRIRNLAKITPTAVEQLATFAEQAGQIGIEGMPAVYRWTNLMNKLMIGTDVDASSISEDMGRIANAFGMNLNTEEGMSQMEKIASVMDMVAKKTATDMDGIVTSVMDAAVIGPMLKIPTQAVVAMVGELISSGVDASAAGTNLSRFFTGALKNADKFAGMMKGYKREIIDDSTGLVTGFTEPYSDMQSVIDEINAHPVEVLTDALGALANATEPDRAQALKNFFDSVGYVGARIGAMAKNYKELKALIRDSNNEFDEATTLQMDYAAMLMTSQSQVQIFKNNFRDLGMTLGSVVLPKLNEIMQYLIPVMQALGDEVHGLVWTYPATDCGYSHPGCGAYPTVAHRDNYHSFFWSVGRVPLVYCVQHVGTGHVRHRNCRETDWRPTYRQNLAE